MYRLAAPAYRQEYLSMEQYMRRCLRWIPFAAPKRIPYKKTAAADELLSAAAVNRKEQGRRHRPGVRLRYSSSMYASPFMVTSRRRISSWVCCCAALSVTTKVIAPSFCAGSLSIWKLVALM